jgi:hypothetical protein
MAGVTTKAFGKVMVALWFTAIAASGRAFTLCWLVKKLIV